MTKNICLKFPINSHYDYKGMHISEKMEASELLKIIGAKELAECDHHTGNRKFKEFYRNSGKLENRSLYEVHTDNFDKTLELIKDYNHKN